LERGKRTRIHELLGHEGAVTTVSFSANGETLASGGYDKTVRLWNVLSGKKIRLLHKCPDNSFVSSVAFSKDPLILATVDNCVRLWDLTKDRQIRSLGGEKGKIHDISFSPDGKNLATAEDNAIRLWEVAKGKEIRSFPGSCKSLAFSPSGKLLAGGDQFARVFDIASGKEIQRITNSSHGSFMSVEFCAMESRLATGLSDGMVLIWPIHE